MHRRWKADLFIRGPLALALLAGAGCAAQPAVGADAGWPDAPPGILRVATGASSFEPFEDGATLELVPGCQGAQHVYVSLRIEGTYGDMAEIELALYRERDSARVSARYAVRLPLGAPEGPLTQELVGLTLVVPEPDQALGESLRLEIQVTAGGHTYSATRTLSLRWGEGLSC